VPARLLAIWLVLALARPAHAESDTDRAIRLGSMTTLGGLYLTIEFPMKLAFAARHCAWCEPPGFDRAVRDALKWDNTAAPHMVSNVLGFAAAPIVLSAMMLGAEGGQRSWRRTFDDLSPMVEAAIVVSLTQSTVKYIVRRQRPFVHFASKDRPFAHDDNTSFYSGHTSAVLAETFACGIVAHQRGYALEPAIWATGITIGVVTGYLRIAADKHYATDVIAGALIGTVAGLAVPYLLHPAGEFHDADVVIAKQPHVVSFGLAF